MCLISVAPKGSNKYSDLFLGAIKKGLELNRDGSGFAYKIAKTGAVYVCKGIYRFEELLEQLKRLNIKEEDELVVHSRTATYGAKTKENTHPFILNFSKDVDIDSSVLGPRTTHYPVMFHNGSLPAFKSDDENSDTYNFGNNFMKVPEIYKMFIDDKDRFEAVFKSVYSGSRFAFLYRNHDVRLLGDGWIKENSYYFSNSSYRNYHQTTMRIVEKALKVEDNFKALGLNTIKINHTNFDEFIIRVTKECFTGLTRTTVGDKFFIRRCNKDEQSVMLELFDRPSEYRMGISLDTINTCFELIPKAEYAKKYTDLIRLHSEIRATKSAVKKVYNNFKTHVNRRHNKDIITLNYGDTKLSVNVVSTLMYLKDYQHYIPGVSIKELATRIGHEHVMV